MNVYVTLTGTVQHKSKACRYLRGTKVANLFSLKPDFARQIGATNQCKECF